MINKKSYEVLLEDGSAQFETMMFNGFLEYLTILTDEKVQVEITYKSGAPFVLFSAWIDNDSLIPLRLVPRNQNNESLAFAAEKIAVNDSFTVYLKGRPGIVVTLGFVMSEQTVGDEWL